ncbi:MAG: hypothetical protein Q9174_000034 [Haloplaca sp. 1 TL-2023]
MSDQSAPRVKLPAVTPPRMAQSSLNSWAASQDQSFAKTPKATNRDRYENKPMPPTPDPSPSPVTKPLTARKNRERIQPAVPLVSPVVSDPKIKSRAATDPVVPKPLFTSTTSAVNQLRKKYSQSRKKSKSIIDEDEALHRPPSPPSGVTQKASQILGVYPVRDNRGKPPPASAPPSSHTPDPFRTSTESTQAQNPSPPRQVQSTPVPTRRFLRENNLPEPTGTRTSQESKEALRASGGEKAQDKSVQDAVSNNDFLHPTRLAVSGKKGEVGYVRENEMQRVLSFTGVIEQPDSPSEGGNRGASDSARNGWTENNGRTLPPFSPFHHPQPLQPPPDSAQRSFSQTSGEVPIVLQRFAGESSHGSAYTNSLRSQNSRAPSAYNNSFAQANPPSSVAESTPRFSTHMRNNSVPPPPTSYPGFQPAGPLPPSFTQMELNLHHHIETCFGSLMRLTTDNTDRTIDKMVRRSDEVQDTLEKGLRVVKNEIKDIRKEMGNIRKDVVSAPQASEKLENSIKSLSQKLDKIDEKVGKIEKNYRPHELPISESDQEASSAHSEGQPSPQQRSQSVHASVSSSQVQRQPYTSGASGTTQASDSTQQSGNSRGRRSTASNPGGALRRSDEQNANRRDIFAQMEAVNVPVPDIREHPAFRGVAEEYGRSSPIYQAPNYSDIWYQRVHGARPY